MVEITMLVPHNCIPLSLYQLDQGRLTLANFIIPNMFEGNG